MIKYLIILFTGLFAFAFAHKSAHLSVNVPAHKKALQHFQVGVIMQMPFAQNIKGKYSGIAVDVWNEIAGENGWSYTYIPITNNTESALHSLNGKLDVIIGPLKVSSERLEIVDFSRPFFISSVNVITNHTEMGFLDGIKRFLSHTLLISLAILSVSFVIFISIIRYIEKGKLNDVFTHYFNALTKGIWFHLFRKGMSVPKAFYARLMLTPTSVVTRMVSILWLLLAAAVFTTINASFVASMTLGLNNNKNKFTTLRDLEAARVAGVSGEENIEIAETNGIYIRKVATLDEGIKLLRNSTVDAVVCDSPVCIEYLRRHKLSGLELSPLILQNEELAFAVKLNSPLKHQIDLGITQLQENHRMAAICKRYIGAKEIFRCSI